MSDINPSETANTDGLVAVLRMVLSTDANVSNAIVKDYTYFKIVGVKKESNFYEMINIISNIFI